MHSCVITARHTLDVCYHQAPLFIYMGARRAVPASSERSGLLGSLDGRRVMLLRRPMGALAYASVPSGMLLLMGVTAGRGAPSSWIACASGVGRCTALACQHMRWLQENNGENNGKHSGNPTYWQRRQLGLLGGGAAATTIAGWQL